MSTMIRHALVALAALLMLAAVVASAAAQMQRGGPTLPTATPAPVTPGAAPTMDRLAPPPTVASPNQADEGAQLFWLHCQPCHGDRGQGLTDEWRAQYPPEDQYCWNSGCHGPHPYDQAFQLPTTVPAVIGDGTLRRFPTLDSVYRYVSVAMPYFFPGDLTQEEYLAIVAHIARGNGLWDGRTLTLDNLSQYAVPGAVAATPSPPAPAATPIPPAVAQAQAAASTSPTPSSPSVTTAGRPAHFGGVGPVGLAAGGAVVFLALGGLVLWIRRSRSS